MDAITQGASMDGKQVRHLEAEIGDAIERILDGAGTPIPSPQVIHLMAKAAVTVLEAAETQDEA
jgi:hypothetical protein